MKGWTATHFLDAHSHLVEGQAGGLLIGLEGLPKIAGTLTNAEAAEVADGNPLFLPIHYLTRDFPANDSVALKYHPRREGYSAEQIIEDLGRRSNARLVVIDTLNEPEWDFKDYWGIVKAYPTKQFVLAHGGGADAPNVSKIAMFEANAWIDFSYTQTYFGFTGERTVNRLVCDTIGYCITEPTISKRCLFGTDNPFVSQTNAAAAFDKLPNAEALLGGNLLRLFDLVRG